MVSHVSAAIGLDFCFPFFAEFVSPRRKAPAVPKVAIYEYCHAGVTKNKIWPARQVAHLLLRIKTGGGQKLGNNALGTCIFSANSRHDPRTRRRVHEITSMRTFAEH